MTDLYTKAMLTIIAAALCAITAKLYVPEANRIGPHIGMPTRQDLLAIKNIDDPGARRKALMQLKQDVPFVWVDGGNVEVSGYVTVDGAVEIER